MTLYIILAASLLMSVVLGAAFGVVVLIVDDVRLRHSNESLATRVGRKFLLWFVFGVLIGVLGLLAGRVWFWMRG